MFSFDLFRILKTKLCKQYSFFFSLYFRKKIRLVIFHLKDHEKKVHNIRAVHSILLISCFYYLRKLSLSWIGLFLAYEENLLLAQFTQDFCTFSWEFLDSMNHRLYTPFWTWILAYLWSKRDDLKLIKLLFFFMAVSPIICSEDRCRHPQSINIFWIYSRFCTLCFYLRLYSCFFPEKIVRRLEVYAK